MKCFLPTITCLFFSLFSVCSTASERPLFAENSVFNAVLTAPLSQVYRHKNNDVRLYMPGTLSFLDTDGTKKTLHLSVRTRGIFRRANCRLPPLLLNFKKKTVADTLFTKQDKLKLVSPCAPSDSNQQRIVLEYLAYQAFEAVANKSLKTRLVRMSYVDSDNKKRPWTHLTFVIEDEKALAKRHDISAIHVPIVQSNQLDNEQAAVVELFQLMIGNTDYSMRRTPGEKDCCHNMQFIGNKKATTGYFPVPYDFDASGLVDAKYAVPAEKLPIDDVKKRLFRGLCRSDETMASAVALFKNRKTDILALFENSEHLNSRYKKKSLRYLNQFFEILDSPKRIEREITNRCRGKPHAGAAH